MESQVDKEGKYFVNITVFAKGYICYNIVGDNSWSHYFVLKYGLDMLIEWVRVNINRGEKWSRSGGWVDTSTRTTTRLLSWVAWVKRWSDWKLDMSKVLYTYMCLGWGWNNNNGGVNSNILAKFPLKIVPMTTINCVGFSIADNCWEAVYFFWS